MHYATRAASSGDGICCTLRSQYAEAHYADSKELLNTLVYTLMHMVCLDGVHDAEDVSRREEIPDLAFCIAAALGGIVEVTSTTVLRTGTALCLVRSSSSLL